MCGIAGILERRRSEETLERQAGAMARALRHRGPDDEGVWTDADAGVALASRRLAILDLSPAGHQPMVSPSGRFVLAFNGEIYNAQELRDAILLERNVAFRGHSDTEVILAALEKWGLEGTLTRCNGMFAMAIWDRQRRELLFARDRLGEKPLYYGWAGETFLFASELKALRTHPDFTPELDREALALFLRHSYVPAPRSIYQGIRKLPPGSYAVLRADARLEPQVKTYWSLADVAMAAEGKHFRGPEAEAVEQLEALLRDSVRLRMIADVPLGAFLSGGIDSSTVVACMQAESTQPVRTFSIGTEDQRYNEAQDAHAVARHLRTEHTELYVTPQQAMEVIPLLPQLYDEPFADSSQIPTYLVAKLARQYVTVSLSGDGGDEVFGGYNRHLWTRKLWKTMRWMPRAARGQVGRLLAAIPAARWEALAVSSPRALQQRTPGYKVHKLAGALGAHDVLDLYRQLATHWRDPVVRDVVPPAEPGEAPPLADLIAQMMYLDTVTYLPDDILVKVDRATMGVSLEGRVPLLDHRLVEFAWRLPMRLKVRGTTGKWVLRQVLYKHVPRALVERPKTGFGIPIGDWLRGPLRGWAEELLAESRLRNDGYFELEPVREKWEQLLKKQGSWDYHVWDILMFQAWAKESRGLRSPSLSRSESAG